MREDLIKSDFFVQLFSAFPGKRPPYLPKGCARFQHDLAQELGKPILQWRFPELDLSKVHDPDQRDLLQLETVYAVGIEEFKAEIVKKVLPQKKAAAPQKNAPLIFINKHPNDIKLADDICQTLREIFHSHIRLSNPQPSANSKIVERWILRCDGVMIIYGNTDAEWVEAQYLDMLDFNEQKRKEPFSALSVYEGPPGDKTKLTFDCDILRCQDCLKDQEIRRFVDSLRLGGTS